MAAPSSSTATAALMEEMRAMRDQVDEWGSSMVDSADVQKGAFDDAFQASAAECDRLTAEKKHFASDATAAAQRRAVEQDDAERRMLEVAGAQQAFLAAAAKLDAVRAEQSDATDALVAANHALADGEQRRRWRVDELTKGAALYKKLGLDFERVENDQLRLCFTQVDAARPQREFSLQVRVDANDVYHVTRVEPGVAALPALVEELNATNDFSRFVRSMRAAFKAGAAAGQ